MGSDRRSSPAAKVPHFIKIIHSGIAQDLRLSIPNKFMRSHGRELGSTVFLTVPTRGKSWRVELIKSNGKSWLENGWQQFKEFFSIAHGHFLVFRYEGDSHFLVLIFDMSATEIEYPVQPIPTGKLQLQSSAPAPAPATYFRPEKKNRINPTGEKGKIVVKMEEIEISDSEKLIDRLPVKKKRDKTTAAMEKEESAKSFKSENPFFRITMRPSYVDYRFSLSIPRKFAEKHFGKENNVVLQASDGRTWNTKCRVFPQNAKLSGGWNTFVRENHLKVDDVCVFELINGATNLLKVHVF